ncbi:GntR family transcriptional regulator [Humitalea rosea]|uniref:GntR family transcriptional regulator n=2 Tax=Humitalea rosea TaxID=990373 RepID=A0A2W7ISP7_9PROT|nr:GntR family transcriptional regulator [Humitalea rosea]
MHETSMTTGPQVAGARVLTRGGGVALWRQIAGTLEEEIRSGARSPGERLPTEAELSQRFAVNRHTLRRAMEEMESKGLVRIEQGRGSFVAEDVVDYPLGPRTRFSESIRRLNREPGGKILDIAEVPAEPQVAEALRIRPGRMVLRVERLSSADGRAVVLGTHYFPLPRFAAMARRLMEDSSITFALAACGVADYRRLSTRISARLPTPEEAETLGMARARPVILTEAINVDGEGVPIDASWGRYPAHRVQLVVES